MISVNKGDFVKMVILLTAVFCFSSANADVWVNGYLRNDGTYVQGHMRTAPNGTTTDNYSTQGNVNPYTGQVGTQNNNYGTTTNTLNLPKSNHPSFYYSN